MTALSDALLAAQARAVAAIGKQYGAEHVSHDEARDLLTLCGCTDKVEIETLLACWSTIRAAGAQAPAEQAAHRQPEDEKATPPQLALIARLCKEKKQPAPDTAGMSKQKAHEVIDALKAGTYDPTEWAIPF